MEHALPSRDTLKAQAKRLRADLAARGTPITHAQALETLAHQWGMRDWNTLSARLGNDAPTGFAPGMAVTGRYLGHRFTAEVTAARKMAQGHWQLTLRFDRAIDVVTSKHFSNFRRQVNCTVDACGNSPHKFAGGQPQMVIDPS
ncbi:glyoxalase superfamily protein [Pseudosulfitobacter koreensis]|uniref:Glyoxalase superfamily protein n=1 Tax=Pseudosulfitobacter koreensis TaxID=2968472 RepID=A0ABT1YXS3_9RHOB|nr:glyoxalase superfamily protein [Pseudosulfitobacter koreense]MCR8825692.1 glyoxalase superfamily protein [Pseudosulfitobacter koreense]